ncbi:MAG: hypothetical protein ACREO4_13015 [Lysobacter sp.]
MAPQIVPTTKPAPFFLPHDQVIRASQLIYMAEAIVDLMSSASASDQQPNDDSIGMAAIAVAEMLKELDKITGMRVDDGGEG